MWFEISAIDNDTVFTKENNDTEREKPSKSDICGLYLVSPSTICVKLGKFTQPLHFLTKKMNLTVLGWYKGSI